MREGVVVMQFRDLSASDLELLRSLQEAVPDGTIVAPNDTGMPFVVAVTAYRRLLGVPDAQPGVGRRHPAVPGPLRRFGA